MPLDDQKWYAELPESVHAKSSLQLMRNLSFCTFPINDSHIIKKKLIITYKLQSDIVTLIE